MILKRGCFLEVKILQIYRQVNNEENTHHETFFHKETETQHPESHDIIEPSAAITNPSKLTREKKTNGYDKENPNRRKGNFTVTKESRKNFGLKQKW